MKLNRRNLSKMKPEQKAEYEKKLEYARERNIYLRKVKEGEVPKGMTFKRYRTAAEVANEKSKVKRKVDLSPPSASIDLRALIAGIENLCLELRKTEERRMELISRFKNIVPLAS